MVSMHGEDTHIRLPPVGTSFAWSPSVPTSCIAGRVPKVCLSRRFIVQDIKKGRQKFWCDEKKDQHGHELQVFKEEILIKSKQKNV